MLSTNARFNIKTQGEKTFALHNGDYKEVINGNFNLIFTSPPYNIGSKSPARILGRRRYGIFDPKSFRGITDYSDTLPEDAYQKQQQEFLVWCSEHLLPEGVVVYNHKDRRKNKRMLSPETWFPKELVLVDRVIWDRGSTHNHDKTQLWSHTEFLYILKRREDRNYYFNNEADGCPDSRSNVWRIPRSPSWHNASFPLKLALRVVRKWCPPSGSVCDPYSGSGTTMAACVELNRNFIGSEIKTEFYLKCVDRITNRSNNEYASNGANHK